MIDALLAALLDQTLDMRVIHAYVSGFADLCSQIGGTVMDNGCCRTVQNVWAAA